MIDYSTWNSFKLRRRQLDLEIEIESTGEKLKSANPMGAYFSNTVTYAEDLNAELLCINNLLKKVRR